MSRRKKSGAKKRRKDWADQKRLAQKWRREEEIESHEEGEDGEEPRQVSRRETARARQRFRPIALFSILSRAFGILLRHGAPILLVQFAVNIPIYVLHAMSGGSDFAVLRENIVFLVTSGVLILFCFLLGSGATIKLVQQANDGQATNLSVAVREAFSRAPVLLVTCIVFALVVTIGAVIGFIPALLSVLLGSDGAVTVILLMLGLAVPFFVAIKYGFSLHACMLEQRNPIKAIDRSEKLTRGYMSQLFFILIALVIINGLVGWGLYWLFGRVIAKYETPNDATPFFVYLAVAGVSLVMSVYGSVCWTLAFLDIRSRKEIVAAA